MITVRAAAHQAAHHHVEIATRFQVFAAVQTYK
jgi:hypothetical protein